MTAAEHKAAAEALLADVRLTDTSDKLAAAHIHAVLATAFGGLNDALDLAARDAVPAGEIELDTPPGWKGTRGDQPPPLGPGCNCTPGMTWSCPRHGAVL